MPVKLGVPLKLCAPLKPGIKSRPCILLGLGIPVVLGPIFWRLLFGSDMATGSTAAREVASPAPAAAAAGATPNDTGDQPINIFEAAAQASYVRRLATG